MYPIAATVADELGIPVKAMTIAVMLGASAAWINPYGYQCNLMVYTAGNYTFKEFAIFGAPFQASTNCARLSSWIYSGTGLSRGGSQYRSPLLFCTLRPWLICLIASVLRRFI